MKKIIAGVLAAATALLFASCGEKKIYGGFELGHFDGSDYESGYDTSLLYRNTSELLGGDSGVIWVSKEENEEFGGYFYQYMSGAGGVGNTGIPTGEDGRIHESARDGKFYSFCAVTRSKDLNDWQLCGAADNGFGVKVSMDAWMTSAFWAPECIYDKTTNKYYLYFGAKARVNDGGIEGAEYVSNGWYGGVAVSESPAGPFVLATSENIYGDATAENPNGEILDEKNPTFMFEKYFDLASMTGNDTPHYNYYADPTPFRDENGDLYLYFNKQGGQNGFEVWGMKMKDPVTPDYTTLSLCIGGGTLNCVRALYKGDPSKNAPIYDGAEVNEEYPNDPAYPRWKSSSWNLTNVWADGTVNVEKFEDGTANPDFNGHVGIGSRGVREGAQVFTNKDKDGKTVYYMSTTLTGVQSADYNIHWATSHSPLGAAGDEFTFPKNRFFGMILGVDGANDFMSNLGHVQFLNVDNEWWIAHWEWPEPFGTRDIGRLYALSKMVWIEDDRVNFPVPIANGPTLSLQALPSVYTGYTNVAGEATITVTNGDKSTIKYLNDGLVVTTNYYQNREFKSDKSTTITLTFDAPKRVRGILIHNSYNYDYAFSEIDGIRFRLSEAPDYMDASAKNCYIRKLGFDKAYYNADQAWIQPGAAAVATFDELKVEAIEIDLSINKLLGSGKQIRISDIEILGA